MVSYLPTGKPNSPTGKQGFQCGISPGIFVLSTTKEINFFQTFIKIISIMKNLTLSIATTLTLIIGLSLSLSAQTTATWQGGKPGRTTEWNCAANWREGRVPDEFSQVIIPTGVIHYPVLKAVETIDALLVEGGSVLTIKKGASLVILGETGRYDGLTLLGNIWNDGKLERCRQQPWNTAMLERIKGGGSLTMPDSCNIVSTVRK